MFKQNGSLVILSVFVAKKELATSTLPYLLIVNLLTDQCNFLHAERKR